VSVNLLVAVLKFRKVL